jgi:hypothetical protein
VLGGTNSNGEGDSESDGDLGQVWVMTGPVLGASKRNEDSSMKFVFVLKYSFVFKVKNSNSPCVSPLPLDIYSSFVSDNDTITRDGLFLK